MKLVLVLVTDAWLPQVNGVVTTLVELVQGLRARGHEVEVIEPSGFRRFACPGYRELELAWRPGAEVSRRLDALQADAVHIATEGPLGGAARNHCKERGWAFTTAFHTRLPDILAKTLHVPPPGVMPGFGASTAPRAASWCPARACWASDTPAFIGVASCRATNCRASTAPPTCSCFRVAARLLAW